MKIKVTKEQWDIIAPVQARIQCTKRELKKYERVIKKYTFRELEWLIPTWLLDYEKKSVISEDNCYCCYCTEYVVEDYD